MSWRSATAVTSPAPWMTMMLLSPFYSSPGSTVSEARPELDSQWPQEARSSGRSLVRTIAGKKKLLQKQAAGKKKMQAIGKVNVPSEPWRQIPLPVVDIRYHASTAIPRCRSCTPQPITNLGTGARVAQSVGWEFGEFTDTGHVFFRKISETLGFAGLSVTVRGPKLQARSKQHNRPWSSVTGTVTYHFCFCSFVPFVSVLLSRYVFLSYGLWGPWCAFSGSLRCIRGSNFGRHLAARRGPNYDSIRTLHPEWTDPFVLRYA